MNTKTDILLLLASKINKDNIVILNLNNRTKYALMLDMLEYDFTNMIDILVGEGYLKLFGEQECMFNPYKYNRTSKDCYFNATRIWETL